MLAVLGATGYTGRLVVRELARRGLPVVAVGRNPHKLAALEGDLERRVADVTDPPSLARALRGVRAFVSCVGPFVDLGEPALRAALQVGAHYLDTTGEQAFVRTVLEAYDEPARRAGVALVPSVGFESLPGDMAAALAARALGQAPEAVEVAYLVSGARASEGTKRTGLRVASLPCLVTRDGELVPRRTGEAERRFPFPPPWGEANVALWPGGEALTVPRHTGARDVCVLMRMPRVAAAAARRAALAGPLVRAGQALLGSGTGGPTETQRARARFCVVADARAGPRVARCVVEGRDPYGLTAAACAEALRRLADPGFGRSGALAPAQAFDPQGFLDALGDVLRWRVEPPRAGHGGQPGPAQA